MIVLFELVNVPVLLLPTWIAPVALPEELPRVTVPPPVSVALELVNLSVPWVRLRFPEFVSVPVPVISRVDPLPTMAMVPALLNVAMLATSVLAPSPPPPYSVRVAPELLVKVPLTVTEFVPPENPLENVPELLTLPVIDKEVFEDAPSDKFNDPPLEIVSVPPAGVTAVVWLLLRFNIPSTLFKCPNPLDETLPLITFNDPAREITDPETTSVIPCPPPVMFKVAPLAMLSVPELLKALTFATSLAPYSVIEPPAALVKVPLTFSAFFPP